MQILKKVIKTYIFSFRVYQADSLFIDSNNKVLWVRMIRYLLNKNIFLSVFITNLRFKLLEHKDLWQKQILKSKISLKEKYSV